MKFFPITMIAAALMLVAACAGPPSKNEGAGDGASIEEMRAEAWEKIDKGACASKGGIVRQEGLLGMPRCTVPYSDAGASCADSSNCEGRCFANDNVTDYAAAAGEARGLCEADDSPFGCYAEIRDGTVDAMLCVD